MGNRGKREKKAEMEANGFSANEIGYRREEGAPEGGTRSGGTVIRIDQWRGRSVPSSPRRAKRNAALEQGDVAALTRREKQALILRAIFSEETSDEELDCLANVVITWGCDSHHLDSRLDSSGAPVPRARRHVGEAEKE